MVLSIIYDSSSDEATDATDEEEASDEIHSASWIEEALGILSLKRETKHRLAAPPPLLHCQPSSGLENLYPATKETFSLQTISTMLSENSLIICVLKSLKMAFHLRPQLYTSAEYSALHQMVRHSRDQVSILQSYLL